jgi:hypothetical protein
VHPETAGLKAQLFSVALPVLVMVRVQVRLPPADTSTHGGKQHVAQWKPRVQAWLPNVGCRQLLLLLLLLLQGTATLLE